MSFDIYLIVPSRDGEPKFERAIAERAFKNIVPDMSGDYWDLDPELSLAGIHIKDEPMISGFSVNRPPAISLAAFWEAMFEVMVQTRTILAWPGPEGPKPSYCVANPDLIAHPTPEMIDLGPPAIATSGAEIYAAMRANLDWA